MKKTLFLLLFFLFSYSFARAEEKIDRFDVEIDILSNGRIKVQETIGYDFGENQKHGIYRDIPLKYQARGGNYNLRLSDLSVNDESLKEYPFSLSWEGDNRRVKIGEADSFVTGKKIYKINYTIDRAINFFNDHDELYWNVTGDEWAVPILASSAIVRLPSQINADQINNDCFSGGYGSIERCDKSEVNSQGVSFSQGSLDLYSGFTVVVGWPKGLVAEPGRLEKIYAIAKDNWYVFLPVVTLFGMVMLWWRFGRDPKGRGTIIVQYDLPDRMTPAEAGSIIDERVDGADISSEIIKLAISGHLRIKNIKKERVMLPDSQEYWLEKLKDSSDLAILHQKKLLDKMFKHGQTMSQDDRQATGVLAKVRLDDLKQKFYPTYEKILEMVYDRLVEQKYFTRRPDTLRNQYMGASLAMFILGIFGGAILSNGYFFGSALVSAVIIFIFSLQMPQKTLTGVLAKEHILGLKDYLQVAEAERIKFHNAPEKNPQTFEKFLPYAMALGVEKEWAKQFEGIYQSAPDWYVDSTGQAGFNPVFFIGQLNSFSESARSNISTPPAASHSSGLGGGGFSGGGFGGGGGGSW